MSRQDKYVWLICLRSINYESMLLLPRGSVRKDYHYSFFTQSLFLLCVFEWKFLSTSVYTVQILSGKFQSFFNHFIRRQKHVFLSSIRQVTCIFIILICQPREQKIKMICYEIILKKLKNLKICVSTFWLNSTS